MGSLICRSCSFTNNLLRHVAFCVLPPPSFDAGWQEGICLDENGNDQNNGVLFKPEPSSSDQCLNRCKKQELPTACEYQTGWKKCMAHTRSVSSASGVGGWLGDSLCFVLEN